MYLLTYLASTGSRSQEDSLDVSASSDLLLLLMSLLLTISDWSFLPIWFNPLSGVLSLLSMEFDNSVSAAFLFIETVASPIVASFPELTCFTAFILWEICESIKIER